MSMPSACGRILIIENDFIAPDHDSGSVRLKLMMDLFLEMRCHVTYLVRNFAKKPVWLYNLTQRGVEVLLP